MAGKAEKLVALARQRQKDRLPPHASIGEFHRGAYEADHVSPWTKSASNCDSPLMVVAQDWAGSDYLAAAFRPVLVEFGYDPSLPTNKNLQRLLRTHFRRDFSQVYATNLFPFAKAGAMKATIPAADMRYSARKYLLPQIEIVQPTLVICLGRLTYNTVRNVLGLDTVRAMDAMVSSRTRLGSTSIVGVAHPGQLGTNHRGIDQVEKDWAALAREFSRKF